MIKRIKKNAMTLVALAIAVGSFTIMSFRDAKVSVEDWYEFTGDDPTNGSHYDLVEDIPDNCEVGSTVCAIKPLALDSQGDPVIDAAMQALIDQATSQQQSTTNVKVRD